MTLFELNRSALQQNRVNDIPRPMVAPESPAMLTEPAPAGAREPAEGRRDLIESADSFLVSPPPNARLVAWSDPDSLSAEKFRALAVRLDDMRREHDLKAIQVTSSVISEGKTFVSANLAVTLAKYTRARTLLVEGDLHRPRLAAMFGLDQRPGISDWWATRDREITSYLVRSDSATLWMLPAGKACDRPSEILHSARLAEAFVQLSAQFDWIIVDSTPMLPVIDANLWSRLVDGTLLVVREGVTPLKALRNGLQSLDHPRLIGVVVNEATQTRLAGYERHYYGARD